MLINSVCKPSLGEPGNVTKILQAKMGKKLTSLNRYILVITDIDEKWFVIFEHTINHLSFGYARLPQLENFFFLFCFFLIFCIFLVPFSTHAICF